MDRYLRDPIWQFVGVVYTVLGILSAIPALQQIFWRNATTLIIYMVVLLLPLLTITFLFERARIAIKKRLLGIWKFFKFWIIKIIRMYLQILIVFLLYGITIWSIISGFAYANLVGFSLIFLYLITIVILDTKNRRHTEPQLVYDFFANNRDARAYKILEEKTHKNAICDGKPKPSLWAQPATGERGWYLYHISPPRGSHSAELSVSIGIRDDVRVRPGTSMKFTIQLNNNIVFEKTLSQNIWDDNIVPILFEGASDQKIHFITESIDKSQGSGAVWGNPMLYFI